MMTKYMKTLRFRCVGIVAALLLCIPAGLMAQPNQGGNDTYIRGRVLSEDGEPLIGASVQKKGTTQGTVTDLDGMFSLQLQVKDVISVSFLGYTTQEVTIKDRKLLTITMREDNKLLDDVVVVGYGVQKKSDITGAISSVNGKDLHGRSVTSAEYALQGKTAGLQLVSNTGSHPGSSPTIRIRGFSSNYGSDPLYVIDGRRTTNIGNLDPNNIESIEVLKDAASAAIYGAEAGNGVILVTTKRGSQGSARISYDFQYTFNNVVRKPKVMNAFEFLTYQLEGGSLTESDIQNAISVGAWDGKNTTNWMDEVFETGATQRHNLTLEGGNDRGQYFLSLGLMDDDGIQMGSKDHLKQFLIMTNASYNVKPWLEIGTTQTLRKTHSSSGDTGNSQYTSLFGAAVTLDPTLPVTFSADNLPQYVQDVLNQTTESGEPLYNLRQDKNGDYYSIPYLLTQENYNPYIMNDRSKYYADTFGAVGTVFANFKPIRGLVVTSRFGYNFSATGTYTYSKSFYGNSLGGAAVCRTTENQGVSRTNSQSFSYQWENFANYNTVIAKDHNLQAMAGMAYSESHYWYTGASVTNTQDYNDTYHDIGYYTSDADKSVSGYETYLPRTFSYYGRLSYNYKQRYYLQGAFRADAADLSKLSKNNRWGYFPSVSLGWIVSNEKFFPKDRLPITFLKLRASWGQNGSTSVLSGYPWSSTITTSSFGYPFGTSKDAGYSTNAYPGALENPDLKWETSEQLDFGFDIRLLRDRLSFTFDYFDKKTKDLLVSGTKIPLETGNSAPTINAGNVSNRGIELDLSWRDSWNGLNYSISANMATLRNRVTYLDSSLDRLSTGTTAFEQGHSVWYFRLYDVSGIDPETGLPIFVDHDGVDGITDADKIDCGTGYGKFTYGITLSLEYKGFDFLAFGSGSYGNKIYNAVTRTTTQNTYKEFYDNRWTEDHTDAKYARAGEFTDYSKYLLSNRFIYDGSYFKIKQLQFGYTLPQQYTRKLFIQKARLFVSLDDWFVFTPYFGTDPEVSSNTINGIGIDYGSYPNAKKTVIGFNLSF